jgi:hypothetical protein
MLEELVAESLAAFGAENQGSGKVYFDISAIMFCCRSGSVTRSFSHDWGRLRSLLEAISATSAVMPWGVAPLDSCSMLFCWDSRPDAPEASSGAIGSQVGDVKQSMGLN